MTQQRFLESILYVLRYDFRDMFDDFPCLLDGTLNFGPANVELTFKSLSGDDLYNPVYVKSYDVYDVNNINRDIKGKLYKSLHDIIGDDGHLTDYGRCFADDTESIIARVEIDSPTLVSTVQCFEITEDGIDEYKSHREDIRAFLNQEINIKLKSRPVLRYK